MKTNVLICHAYKTLPNKLWYDWLKKQLVELGYEAVVLEFPAPEAPIEQEWVNTIKNAHADNSVILVGHSLGCRAVLAYINQYKVKIDKIVLVAPPQYWEGITDTRPPLKAYVEGMQEIDYGLVKSLVNEAHIFFGTNDHILSQKDLEFFKKKFGEKVSVHASDTYGHYDVEEIPEMLALFPVIK